MATEIARKQAKRTENAHFYPIAGTVTNCVILDEGGAEQFTTSMGFDGTPGKVSYDALHVISEIWGETTAPETTLTNIGASIFGLKIRDRLCIMALDAMRYARTNGQPLDGLWPGLWYTKPFQIAAWCDPYETVIPSERRNDVTWDGLCEFLGIVLPPDANIETDAKLQAYIALELTLCANLTDITRPANG